MGPVFIIVSRWIQIESFDRLLGMPFSQLVLHRVLKQCQCQNALYLVFPTARDVKFPTTSSDKSSNDVRIVSQENSGYIY